MERHGEGELNPRQENGVVDHRVLARFRRDQRCIGDRDRGVRPALAVTISRPFDFFKVVGGHWKVILGHDRSDGSLTEPATFSFGQAGPRFQNR